MDKILTYFLEEKKVTRPVANVLISAFKRNPDIADEFINWIDTRDYCTENALVVGGYTAEQISKIAPHLDTHSGMLTQVVNLDAAGVYGFLVTLREKPEVAKETIRNNFPEK